MRKNNILLSVLFASFVLSSASLAQLPERTEIDAKYRWDLSQLYADNNAFMSALEEVKASIPEVSSYEGKLGDNAENLYAALRGYFDMAKEYNRLAVYSYRLADEDMRVSDNQSLRQHTQNLGNNFSEATAFIEPEILQIPSDKLAKFFEEKPELEEFRVYLEDIQRMKPHRLSTAEEQILASAGMMSSTPVDVYNIFNNADRPAPKVTLSDGSEIELSNAEYVKYRTLPNREDRAKVFEAFFNEYKRFENTLGTNLAGKVKGDYFYAKNRKYDSVLEYSLDGNNIPVDVYTNLIKNINDNLPTLHRALELKKKMLGLDELHYYDLYMPLVDKVDMEFTVEEGEEVVLEGLAPMGEDYVAGLKKAMNENWIDFYPAKGKRSGAYSSGSAYDVHPYILHNWLDDYESVSTLAHELGHSMHSWFTNNNQPFVNTGYATFVAEIASTVNENLLNKYMIDNAKNEDEKLYLLGSYLELLRTTIFRQVSFAEFEWEIHKKIENNEPLTGKIMSDIYFDIVKKYYGADEGVTVVDDYIAYEWAYIPHFLNYTYYVYQYSTSIIYSTAFAEKIFNEGDPAVENFFHILKGGSSEYPIDLVKKAGIDPLSSEAFDLTMKRMNNVMDQIEEIIKNRKS